MFSGPSSGMFGIGCTSCMVPMIGIAGDLSLGEVSGLINPAAISLLKSNAYQAAKQVLGPKTPDSTLYSAVDAYVAFEIPRTNRAMTVFEIAHDFNFQRMAKKAREDAKSSAAGIESSAKGWLKGYGFVPRLLIYGAVGYGAYKGYKWYRAKHPKGSKKPGFWGKIFGGSKRRKSHRRKSRPMSSPTLSLPVGSSRVGA